RPFLRGLQLVIDLTQEANHPRRVAGPATGLFRTRSMQASTTPSNKPAAAYPKVKVSPIAKNAEPPYPKLARKPYRGCGCAWYARQSGMKNSLYLLGLIDAAVKTASCVREMKWGECLKVFN